MKETKNCRIKNKEMAKHNDAFFMLSELFSVKIKHKQNSSFEETNSKDVLKSQKRSKEAFSFFPKDRKKTELDDVELFQKEMQTLKKSKGKCVETTHGYFSLATQLGDKVKLKEQIISERSEQKNLASKQLMTKKTIKKPAKKKENASNTETMSEYLNPNVNDDLFTKAMFGVVPVKSKGRELVVAKPNKILISPEEHNKTLQGLIDGSVEFSLEYSGEFMQCHVRGLDPLVIEKLKAGSYSYEANLDLHGQTTEQAYRSLIYFIQNSYQRNLRTLIVVTGRGLNSPNGISVLRERIQTWLTKDPFKRVVLGFCTAQAYDGGTGALYILLRKYKKTRFKIAWDRPIDLDTLDG
ncbi:Smr/MutS family protein [Desulfovibrio litoralis]|uniref:Smr/MutS family protein n=1 Tax=Desulfovibrio litoralis TaxID=466107 RepID=UPI0015BD0CE7|nr:Smr/MutS family protein [Desulfovibrio litoralis]